MSFHFLEICLNRAIHYLWKTLYFLVAETHHRRPSLKISRSKGNSTVQSSTIKETLSAEGPSSIRFTTNRFHYGSLSLDAVEQKRTHIVQSNFLIPSYNT
jgi:hypothetical protein